MIAASRLIGKYRHLASLAFCCTSVGLCALASCNDDTRRPASTGQGVLNALDKRSAAKERLAARTARGTTATRAKAGGGGLEKPPMDISKPPQDAQTTASGIAYKVIKTSTDSRTPTGNDTASVHYTMWKPSGEVIYSTHREGKPQPMQLFQSPRGWREVVGDMQVGERRLCWMPGHLASAVQARAVTATLVIQIDLVATHSPPPAPDALDEPPADAQRTESGLAYVVLKPGASADDAAERPDIWDRVAVHYTTWKQNGSLQQDTTHMDKPQRLRPADESKGFGEAVSLLTKGQRNRVWIPEELRMPRRSGDPGGMQVMEIELFDWEDRVGPPPTPADVAGPPASAKKTARGVYYQMLKKGTGTKHPDTSSTVKVHYTGWTTDGEMFDSSYTRGKPITFELTGVIAGWTDVVQVMVVGDAIRTWIPQKLAYKGQAGRPAGMLVFEIELLEIVE